MKIAPPVCLTLLVLLALGSGLTAHAAASSVLIGQSCFSSGVSVAIAWSAGETPVLQQFVDVSLENNGWLPGSYSPQGPLAAGVTSFVLHSLPAGKYYVRINQMLPNGTLEASETVSFVAASCDPNPPALAAANESTQPQAAAAQTQTPSPTTPPETAAANLNPADPAEVTLTSTPELAAAIALAAQLAGPGPVAPGTLVPPLLLAGYPMLPQPYVPTRR